eukprot:731516-Rhodomonas_salina.1
MANSVVLQEKQARLADAPPRLGRWHDATSCRVLPIVPDSDLVRFPLSLQLRHVGAGSPARRHTVAL